MARNPGDFDDYLRTDDGKAASLWEIRILKLMRHAAGEPWSNEKYAQMRETLKVMYPLTRPKTAN
jgi:hypothetical protein